MAINKVSNETKEKEFKFLKNQSTILRTVSTDKITFNGVNVIVEKPKVGDVMCVTKYKNSAGTLLGADKQKIIWIDGLSIVPNQLSPDVEAVGICLVVNGNKAMVKHKTDDENNKRLFALTNNNLNFNVVFVEPNCYFNNGFHNQQQNPTRHPGCCKALYYKKTQDSTASITSKMSNIFNIPNRDYLPVNERDFEDNEYCQILRDNFDTYDEYFDSMMIKVPCGKGTVGKFPSGKYMTYKLASPSFPLLNWAATLSVNAPNLGAGNWWIPSVAEMAQIMHNITYGIPNVWDSNNIDNNTDIVNRVLYRLTHSSHDAGSWHMISATTDKWTSSIYSLDGVYFYNSSRGTFGHQYANRDWRYKAMAITIVEF